MKLIMMCLLFLSSSAHASTFIGNGGSAGDVELLVALKQIEKASSNIMQSMAEQTHCECIDVFEGHSVCEALKKLTHPQKKYCENFVRKEARDYHSILKSEKIRFYWTHDDINVFENKRRRAVEAVANPRTNEITLNQTRFIKLRAYERIFLMTHELTHLIDVDGEQIGDEGPIGPFEGASGKRDLINAAASAIVMEAASSDLISQYRPALDRARGYKKFWLDLSSGGRTHGEITGNKTFGFDNSKSAATVGARWYFAENFGVYLHYRGIESEKTILTSIKATESLNTISAGITYKYFPFKDPLKYFGQSHLELFGGPDLLKAKYKVADNSVGTEDSDESLGFLLGASYRLPVIWGFWLNIGASAEMHKYKFEQVNVEYNGPQITSYFGASYGF